MTKGLDSPHPSPEPSSRNNPGCQRHSTPLPKSDQTSSLLEAFLDALADAISVIGHSGEILLSNKAWKQFCDEWLQKAKGESYYLLLSALLSEEVATLREGIERVFREECPDFQYDFDLAREGERRYYRLKARSVPFPGGARCSQGKTRGAVMLVHQDITAFSKMEQELRESYTLFYTAIEGVEDGVFLFDRDGRIVMVNSVYAHSLGLTVHEMVGKSIFELFPEEQALTMQEQNLMVLTTHRTLTFEQVIMREGKPARVRICKSAYRNHREEIAGVFGIVRYVSDKRGTEESLAKSERHFRALIENSADRVTLLREDGKICYASPSSKRILGFDIDELINVDAFQYVHGECGRELRKRFTELVRRPGSLLVHQYRSLHKDGSWRWMEGTFTNLLEDPSVSAIVLNERDITPRKDAEHALTRYVDIVQSSQDAIISTDPEGGIISWNPAAEQIFGYEARSVVGKDLFHLIGGENYEFLMELHHTALQGKVKHGQEAILFAKDERPVEVSVTISPIVDRDARVVGVVKLIRDISDRRSLEREILETSDREKERIGQDLHDDLCQHLIGISLASDRLAKELEGDFPREADKVRQITRFVRTAVDHARRLARGLSLVHLDESGLESSLEQLVKNTEQLFRVPCRFASDSGIHVPNLDVAKGLFRIAQEALHNAVKHSEATCIEITLKNARDHLIITVSDDGVGMAETKGRVKEGPESGGFGLHGMYYRARSIGATLDFRKNRTAGTSVVCSISKKKCL